MAVKKEIKEILPEDKLHQGVKKLVSNILDFSNERMDKFKKNPGYKLSKEEKDTIDVFLNVAERVDNLLSKISNLKNIQQES